MDARRVLFYIAGLAVVLWRPAGIAASFAGLSLVIGMARIDAVTARPWSRVLRDWMSPGYVLAAYYENHEAPCRQQTSRERSDRVRSAIDNPVTSFPAGGGVESKGFASMPYGE